MYGVILCTGVVGHLVTTALGLKEERGRLLMKGEDSE